MGEISKALSKLTQVAINMMVPILMCLFLGKWLDQKFNTGVVFLFIFLVLGIASSFRNLYVFVIKDFSKEQKKEEEGGYLNLNDYDAHDDDDNYNKN